MTMVTITVDTAKIGRLGGRKRAANMSAEQRQESASSAANARWQAYYAAHPEKLKEKLARAARTTGKRGRPPKEQAKKAPTKKRKPKNAA